MTGSDRSDSAGPGDRGRRTHRSEDRPRSAAQLQADARLGLARRTRLMMPACQTPCWCLLSLAGLLAATCFPALAQKTPDASEQGNSAKYAGAEVCQGCHEDQYKSFAQSAHLETLKKEKASAQGCEGCHGRVQRTLRLGDPDKLRRFADARPESIQVVCTTCHKVNLGEQHSKARLTCLTCHSPHHSQQQKAMLVAEKTQLCQKCHHRALPGPSHL